MSDGIDLGDLPEIPEPVAASAVTDAFDYNVAFRLAFVGVGQAGGRIAATFAALGYGRVCAINTTIADLAELKLDDSRKLDIGQARGAGKDPKAAAAIAADKDEEFFDLFKRSFGDEVDYIMVCLGAAGGTGAGVYSKVIEVAKRYMAETKRPVRVGAIIALPKDAEGQQFAKNALHTMRGVVKQTLSPVLFIDNEKIRALYNPTVGQEKSLANSSTATLLHAFNRIAGSDGSPQGVTFDRADFAKLLDSGVLALGAQTIKSWNGPTDITAAIRDQLKRNILASVDLSKGKVAALLYVLGGDAQNTVRASDLDHGTEMLTRMLADGSTVFPGIYTGTADKNEIKVLAMIGQLPWPKGRLEELAAAAGEPRESVATFLLG